MNLTPVVKENLKKIMFFNFLLLVPENIIFYALGNWSTYVLVGSLYGYVISVVSFLLLGLSVQKAMDKEQKQAQMYMQSTYMARMIFTALAIIIAMKLPFLDWVAVVFPLGFTRISIMLLNLIKKEE